jgi:hypothetical protein
MGKDRNRAKAIRRSNAERQAKLRANREALGLCRTCGLPAAYSKRTGKLSRSCRWHLKVDLARKAVVELTWSKRPARAIGRLFGAR